MTALRRMAELVQNNTLTPCRSATTANIVLAGVQTLDTVALVAGDRVLAKNQTNAAENGVYLVSGGSWTRAPEFNESSDLISGSVIAVTEGAAHGQQVFQVVFSGVPSFGTTSFVFTSTEGPGSAVADIAAEIEAVANDLSDVSVTADNIADIRALSEQVENGTLATLAADFNVGLESVASHGVTGDGSVADQTRIYAAASAAASAGKVLFFPPVTGGVYQVQPLTFTVKTNILIADGTTIKLVDTPSPGFEERPVIKLTVSGSSVEGGIVDGNKAGQSKTFFNTNSGNRNWYGIWVQGAAGALLTGIEISTKVINSANYGLYIEYTDGIFFDPETDGCGAGAIIRNSNAPFIKRAIIKNCNDDGFDIFAHGFDLFFVDSPRGGNIHIINQYGEGTLDAGTAKSNWISGFTMTGVTDPVLSNLSYSQLDDRPDGDLLALSDATKSLAFSFLDVQGGTITGLVGKRFSSVGLEVGGVEGTVITGFDMDSEYMISSLFPAETCDGMHTLNAAGNDNFASVSTQTCRDMIIGTGVFQRCQGPGLSLLAGEGIEFPNVRCVGNRDGVIHNQLNSNPSFPDGAGQLRGIQIIGGDYSFNERYGIIDHGGENLRVIGAKLNNNGQALSQSGALRLTGTFSGASAGYNAEDTASPRARTRTRFINCQTQDTQSVTTSEATAVSTDPRRILTDRPELYHYGQTINLAGCGAAGADLIAQVLDIDQDVLTLSEPIVTFPSSAGTGTISTSGTTVTGSGTSFLSEFPGPKYITAGGETRKIVAATTNTAASLESAFTADLSGASFTITTFAAEQIRSQDYGLRTTNATRDAGFIADGHDFGVGNVTGAKTLAAGAVREAGKSLPVTIPLSAPEWFKNAGSVSEISDGGGRIQNWNFLTGEAGGITTTIDTPEATTYRIYLWWANSNTGTGDVDWILNYHSYGEGDSLDDAGTSLSVTDDAGLQDILVVTDMGTITTTAGEFMRLRLLRAGQNDTLNNDVGFVRAVLVPE